MERYIKISVFLLFVILAIYYGYLYVRLTYYDGKQSKGPSTRQMVGNASDITMNKPHTGTTTTTKTKGERYDILVSGYMRSGSTYTGDTLRMIDGIFYVFEPLQPRLTWWYHKKQHWCDNRRPGCHGRYGFPNYNDSLSFVEDIYRCNLNKRRTRWNRFVANMSGWFETKNCSGDITPQCLTSQERLCREAKHRMVKLLRLTVSSLEPLLERIPNLRIVHILRDPRGIMSSHFGTDWYVSQLTSQIVIDNDLRALCARLKEDIQSGKELMMKYPDRFRFIQYEEYAYDESRLQRIYDYFGITGVSRHKSPLNTTKEAKIFSYRKKLSFDIVKRMNVHCSEVYRELGLREFKTITEYLDTSLNPVVKIMYPLPQGK